MCSQACSETAVICRSRLCKSEAATAGGVEANIVVRSDRRNACRNFLSTPDRSFRRCWRPSARYLLTALGTLPVLFFRSVPRQLMDAMMGFAAGVMVAASCWSLLVPAIERGGVLRRRDSVCWPAGLFCTWPISCCPICTGSFRMKRPRRARRWRGTDSALLMFAMTLHNFPGRHGGRCGLRRPRCRFREWRWPLESGCRTSPKGWRLRSR